MSSNYRSPLCSSFVSQDIGQHRRHFHSSEEHQELLEIVSRIVREWQDSRERRRARNQGQTFHQNICEQSVGMRRVPFGR